MARIKEEDIRLNIINRTIGIFARHTYSAQETRI